MMFTDPTRSPNSPSRVPNQYDHPRNHPPISSHLLVASTVDARTVNARTADARHRRRSRMTWTLLIAAVMGLMGCRSLDGASPFKRPGNIRSIDAVQTQLEVGSTVYVQGRVGDRIPLVDGQVYALEDDTGYIWVVTSDQSIATGEEIVIQGNLSYEATPEFGAASGERYLWETMQIERSPENEL